MTPPTAALTVLSPAAPPAPPLPPDLFDGMSREDFVAQMMRVWDARQTGLPAWDDDDLIERFLGQCSRSGSTETVSAYSREIRRHLLPWIAQHHPGLTLRQLSPAHAQDLVAELRQAVTDGRLAERSFNRRLACWRSLWSFASDPCRAGQTGIVRMIWPRKAFLAVPKVERALSEDNVGKIITEAEVAARQGSKVASRDAVMIRFAYLTGVRVSELVRLQWGDVERTEDGGIVHLRRCKGGKSRSIAVSAATVELIEALPGGRGEDGAWLFPSRRRPGQHLSRQGAGDRFRRWGRAVNVRAFPHAFRASHATVALRRGADIHLIQITLGHASISTTANSYLASNPTDSSSLRLG
jgi:site-specific recombinase XerD